MLKQRPFAHPVACRCVSWVGGHCTTFETGQTISPVQTDAILLASNAQHRWELLRPFARSLEIAIQCVLHFAGVN